MPSLLTLIFTALWHALAFWHFTFYPERTLARTTAERPISPIAVELFRFLGALNASLVALPLLALALPDSARWPIHITLAVANASQALIDLRVQRLGLARGPMFTQILWGDTLFTALNVAAAATA
jgi:hypothetical protein